MKNRICLAWFCDLDAADQRRQKSRPAPPRESQPRAASPRDNTPPQRQPKVKKVSELRRMFGRR